MRALSWIALLAGILFVFFLIGRFAGLTYFPGLRYLNLLILCGFSFYSAQISKPLFSVRLVPSILFFGYCLYIVAFLFYLRFDPHYFEFLTFYHLFGAKTDMTSISIISLFEAIEFSVIAGLCYYFLSAKIKTEYSSQSENSLSRENYKSPMQ